MGNKNANKNNRALKILICVLAAVLLAEVIFVAYLDSRQTPSDPAQNPELPTQTQPAEEPTPAPTEPGPTLEAQEEININLGYGLAITEVGKYTGAYVEDGSDEFVTGVLMLRVTNTGGQDIQYAEITMALSEGEAKFSLSTLPVGKTVILLEQSRLAWDAGQDYAYAVMSNVVAFNESLSLHEDRLQLQALEGGLNVTNISDEDITGDIVIYFKNAQMGLYYGGITYRMRLEGGLKAGQLQQIMSEHFSESGSEIVFITIT